jgi:DNA-binding transcriptional ArsR family regulator
MDAESPDPRLSRVASAIAEPARTRMLCTLVDGRARTSTELAVVAGVMPSTASVHLARLKEMRLVDSVAQGRHRYYALAGGEIARALEALMVVAGGPRERFVPSAPSRLRAARTCYDHMAGTLGVSLHDRLKRMGWLSPREKSGGGYVLTGKGASQLEALGVDVEEIRSSRRRLAYACVDWSERRPHVGGAVGAALLQLALQRKWVVRDLDSRVLEVTPRGWRELQARFGISPQF